MTKHTPTPWELKETNNADVRGAMWIYACGRPGTLVTQSIYGRTIEESDANAALIVRAVNAHDELVAALREAESLLNHSDVRHHITCEMGEHSWLHRTINAARAALAKATGDA